MHRAAVGAADFLCGQIDGDRGVCAAFGVVEQFVEVVLRAAAGRSAGQSGQLPAAHGNSPPGEPRGRPVQGQRRPDRGDADQLGPGLVGAKRMADESEDQAAMAQWAQENAPVPETGGVSGGDWDASGGVDDTLIGSERILNQDEIDSLLGFDLTDDDASERTGIRAIINSALVSYERLPMLEIVFDRLVRLMTTSLRNFTSDNVEVSLDNISSIRFGDYLNSIPLPAILSVFRAEELNNYGLMTVDSNLIYSIVDV
eukprot:gene41724-56492_t